MKAWHYILAYFVLFGTWVALVYLNATGSEQLLGYIQNTLAALTGHALTRIK